VEFEYRPKKPLKHGHHVLVSNFLPHDPDIRKSFAFFEYSNALLICPSDKSGIKMKMSMEQWWNITDRGKPETLEEKRVSVPHYSLKSMWIGQVSNPNLRGERLTTDLWSMMRILKR
jgi:hypothetical protein